MTSSWLTVLLCFERFVAVVFPLKAKSIIIKKIIFSLIALDYVFIRTYNAIWTFSSIVVNGVCKPDVTYPETKQKYRDFLLAGSSFYSLIPMLIMTILTPIIVTKLIMQRKKRRELSSGSSRKDAETIRISAMLVGVVVAYIVFILPITVVHKLAFWKGVSAFDANTYDFFVLREQIAQLHRCLSSLITLPISFFTSFAQPHLEPVSLKSFMLKKYSAYVDQKAWIRHQQKIRHSRQQIKQQIRAPVTTMFSSLATT